MIKVLHITPHLGGGVGRVLSKVAVHRKRTGSVVEDTIVCLEPPEKGAALASMREAGIHVEIQPDDAILDSLIDNADVIQIEWWHHPLVARFISCYKPFMGRLIIWAHVSGISYPVIPIGFLNFPDLFLFTTEISSKIYIPDGRGNSGVVYSSGGFDDIPFSKRDFSHGTLKCGYTGTLSPSKLHPDILSFLHAVQIPDFCVDFYGDHPTHPFSSLARLKGNEDLVRIHGYVPDIRKVMEELDILIYLLNPLHYGSTENGLLEAMASGVIPIVLNNPVESGIVKDGETGFVIDSPASFAQALRSLCENLELRRRMSTAASDDIRSRFSLEKTVHDLDLEYSCICSSPKHLIDGSGIFGNTPFEWFSSCLGECKTFFQHENSETHRFERLSVPILYEKSKASVFQYQSYFPDDPELLYWKEVLTHDLASLSLT
ncbi:glycosyltransferase family 4 protein [Methanospirillum sp. J.3.6.1-F.2.7.3]|uniref:Glycosyltransferase family 4 protein n=1 Tax=Methanospirillum purgamenti TaxID=2834276 RepID=A0A8E7EJZ8_9EURY|nr:MULTISPECIES: glycosyltransferase family 4 protein [Methanospirillum]MDX8551887.1 glycosyltransferase family 4 protein [Methanospirillum hungatei]QVV89161.1 glycosyltransferase family 4 protein [Methanospirillum sp. J.3.6.1-F.2.7.3]